MRAQDQAWRHLPRNAQQLMSFYLSHNSSPWHLAMAKLIASEPRCYFTTATIRLFRIQLARVCLDILQAQSQTEKACNLLETKLHMEIRKMAVTM